MATARDKGKRSKAKREAPDASPTDPRTKLLDAAERLLVDVGHSAVTTRLVSKQAGLNQGLVHYYYGSMEELFLAVLERFTARLIIRQRAMYAADTTFLVKWRKAMGFLEEDLAAGYPKIWLELQAMGWNRPAMRTRLAAVHDEWIKVLTEAFTIAMKHYGIANGAFAGRRDGRPGRDIQRGNHARKTHPVSVVVTLHSCDRSIAGSRRWKRGAK